MKENTWDAQVASWAESGLMLKKTTYAKSTKYETSKKGTDRPKLGDNLHKCNICDKVGHEAKTCYQKCPNCPTHNHHKDKCFKLRKKSGELNARQVFKCNNIVLSRPNKENIKPRTCTAINYKNTDTLQDNSEPITVGIEGDSYQMIKDNQCNLIILPWKMRFLLDGTETKVTVKPLIGQFQVVKCSEKVLIIEPPSDLSGVPKVVLVEAYIPCEMPNHKYGIIGTLPESAYSTFNAKELTGFDKLRYQAQFNSYKDFTAIFNWSLATLTQNLLKPTDAGIDCTKNFKDTRPPKINKHSAHKLRTFTATLFKNGLFRKADDNAPAIRPLLVSKPDKNDRLTFQTAPMAEITSKIDSGSFSCDDSLANLRASDSYMMLVDYAKNFWQHALIEEQAKKQVIWMPTIDQGDYLKFLDNGILPFDDREPRWRKVYFKGLMMGSINGCAIAHNSNKDFLTSLGLESSGLNHVDDCVISSNCLTAIENDRIKLLDKCRLQNRQVNGLKFLALTKSATLLSVKWTKGSISVPEGYAKSLTPSSTNAQALKLVQSLGYFQRFIKHFQIRTAIFHKLAADKPHSHVLPEHRSEISNLITELKSVSIALDDSKVIPKLFTDFSSLSKGAVLTLNNKPLRYWSKANSPTEAKLNSSEGEIIAAAEAMEKFSFFLRGRRFEWWTDSIAVFNAITKYCDFYEMSPFVARRFLRLAQFNFKIFHMAGIDIIADYPSRYFCEDSVVGDTVLVCNHLLSDNTTIISAAKALHESTHLGTKRGLEMCKNMGMQCSYKIMKQIVDNCTGCQMTKAVPCRLPYATIKFSLIKGECFCIDTCTLGIKMKGIVAQDIYSKILIAEAFSSIKSCTVTTFILELKTRHNNLTAIWTDLGNKFAGYVAQACTILNLQHIDAPVASPESNGIAERAVRTLKDHLRPASIPFNLSLRDIRIRIAALVYSYNNTSHSITKHKPLQIPDNIEYFPKATPIIHPNIQEGDKIFKLKRALKFGQHVNLLKYYEKDLATVIKISGHRIKLQLHSGRILDVGPQLIRVPHKLSKFNLSLNR